MMMFGILFIYLFIYLLCVCRGVVGRGGGYLFIYLFIVCMWGGGGVVGRGRGLTFCEKGPYKSVSCCRLPFPCSDNTQDKL